MAYYENGYSHFQIFKISHMSFLIVIIILALVFDYINGFHDAANSIATVVSTKVLTPFQAVLWAALFNFVAFFIFLAPLIGMIAAFILSLWFIHAFQKGILPKLLSFIVIVFVIIFLYFNLELDPAKLKSHYDSYILKVIFFSKNFKWILLALI